MSADLPPDPSPPAEGELGDKLKALVMQASDPKPDHYLHGVLVISFWARHGRGEPETCDFLSTPVEETAAQIRSVAAMSGEMVKKMDGLT